MMSPHIPLPVNRRKGESETGTRFNLFVLLVLLQFFISDASAQMVTAPVAFKKKVSLVDSVLVLPVKFDCYHLTSGGIREYNDAMSKQACTAIMKAVKTKLASNNFAVSALVKDSYTEQCWVKLRHFYSVINREILDNVYSQDAFPDPIKSFAYSLPGIPDSLVLPGTDAVLFVNGFDDCSTWKRRGDYNPDTVITSPGSADGSWSDMTLASCALVNLKGEIIWYFRHRQIGKINMASTDDVDKFITELLRRLTRAAPAE